MGTSDNADTATSTAVADLADFRRRRTARATGPQGFLTLTNTQWIDSAQPVWGVPGTWAPGPEGLGGLTLTAAESDGIVVDGDVVDGTVFVSGDDAIAPSTIRFASGATGTVIRNEGTSSYALRVWDPAADDAQAFGSVSAYEYDPSWVVEASFVATEPDATVEIEHQKDGGATRTQPLPGLIRFSRDGADYELVAFPAGGPGEMLQLVFGDATNGDTTYSVGRFLFPTPNGDGTITLDFNRAVLPPCAFSYNFNCPIPPAQNRFPIAIPAGEQNVLAKDGSLLHG